MSVNSKTVKIRCFLMVHPLHQSVARRSSQSSLTHDLRFAPFRRHPSDCPADRDGRWGEHTFPCNRRSGLRGSIPIAAILVPAAFFLSVLSPDATVPNALIYFAYVGAVVLAAGVLVLGIGR